MFDLLVDGVDVSFERVFESEVASTIFAFVLDSFVNVANVNALLVRGRKFGTADLTLDERGGEGRWGKGKGNGGLISLMHSFINEGDVLF